MWNFRLSSVGHALIFAVVIAMLAASFIASPARAQMSEQEFYAKIGREQAANDAAIQSTMIEIYKDVCGRPDAYLLTMARSNVREQNLLKATCDAEKAKSPAPVARRK